MSSLAARIEDTYRTANNLRARSIPVVIGGLHATALPQEIPRPVIRVPAGPLSLFNKY